MNIFNAALRVVICFGFLFSVSAQHRNAGTVNYQHLLMNYDARSIGMGGADVAMPSAINGIYTNPALLALVKKREAFIGYQLIVDGIWCAPLAYAQPSQKLDNGAFAATIQGLSSGKLDVTDISPEGEPVYTGYTAHNEYMTAGFSYARSFMNSRFIAGATLKGVYQRISAPPEVYSSKGIALDLGIQYRWFHERLIIGAAVRNAGIELQQFKDDDVYPFPLLIEAGISYVPRYFTAVRLAADINKVRGEYVNVEPGIEISLYPDVLFLRFGYMFSTYDFKEKMKSFIGDDDPDYIKTNWNTLSAGVGIQTKIDNVFVDVNFGMQFHIVWFSPSPMLSAVVEF